MRKTIRYFIFILSSLLSTGSFAVDHVLCSLTSAGIPAQSVIGHLYTNTYTCNSTYPSSFPAIQLGGNVQGNASGTSLSGTCLTQLLASGGSCQFSLDLTATTAGTRSFNLQVTVGTVYFLNLPSVNTTVQAGASAITWPGQSSGHASVDATGKGIASFVANAVDSSGHTITYTVKLSGQGTAVINQAGTITLTGINVNAPGTVTVTATADDAASIVGTPIPIVATNGVPEKVLSIYNNSTEAIYPVIETPIQPIDNWMQAQFAITNLGASPFTTTKQYRVYVNPTTGGIPPGGSVSISIPFYTTLVASPAVPAGSQADDYADWWDAMRVYIYDDVTSLLTNGYNLDVPNLLTIPGTSRVPTCLNGSTACTSGNAFSIYAGAQGLPLSDPYQLTEYTFADVVTSLGTPFPIDRTHVDYDISSVDQTYIPVAMEPYGTNQVGYNGSVMDLTIFRAHLASFVSTYSWPIYIGTPAYPYQRVPGAYNVMINNQPLTQPALADTINALTNNWTSCLANAGDPQHANCVEVDNLFTANSTNYQTVCSAAAPSAAEYLQHIYGWVSFTCVGNLNPLASTPAIPGGTTYSSASSAYETLQYSGAFNPYVQLIHSPTYLDTSMYAYSVDDAVGNMNEVGDGVVITVAGAGGLPNPNKYDKSALVNINPGTPPLGSPDPVFTAYGICTHDASSGVLVRGAPFQIQTVTYPCEITLKDSNAVLYHFILKSAPPFTTPPKSNYIDCTGFGSWCTGVNIDFITQHDVPTPPPTP